MAKYTPLSVRAGKAMRKDWPQEPEYETFEATIDQSKFEDMREELRLMNSPRKFRIADYEKSAKRLSLKTNPDGSSYCIVKYTVEDLSRPIIRQHSLSHAYETSEEIQLNTEISIPKVSRLPNPYAVEANREYRLKYGLTNCRCRLPIEVADELAYHAHARGISQSDVIRHAVMDFQWNDWEVDPQPLRDKDEYRDITFLMEKRMHQDVRTLCWSRRREFGSMANTVGSILMELSRGHIEAYVDYAYSAHMFVNHVLAMGGEPPMDIWDISKWVDKDGNPTRPSDSPIPLPLKSKEEDEDCAKNSADSKDPKTAG